MVYIPTGDIFILAKRVKHILVHGVNLDWHEGATLTGFSTPLGTYNPDWAVYVKGVENKVYFVVETKGTEIFGELRPAEQDKIRCARKHFEVVAPEVIVSAPVKDGKKWLSNL